MQFKDNKKLDDRMNLPEIEQRCNSFWNETGVYTYDANKSREETFIIDTPPPTVSGSLHIGHIFSYTQTDIIARYQRMTGKTVFYPVGWDDNGLPTERRVQNYFNITCDPNLPYENNLVLEHSEKNDAPKKRISRKNFIEACDKLTASDEQIFENVFRNIGHSYDWNLKYTTISEQSIKISQASFIDLYNKGFVKSVESPTMWDVTFQSAVAQAEIEDKEVSGFFHDINFQVEGSDENITIATTRPEFLPACIAIVAHPDDERYQKYFGKKAIVPLFKTPVEIIPSEHAEKDKGTGIMMVCTFGDAADVAWWKTSGLPLKQIIGLDGCLIDVKFGSAPFVSLDAEKANACYQKIVGLSAKQAREKIVEMLREEGALKCEPRPLVHMVKFYEKGNRPLEFVTSRQWFIRLQDKKDELIAAGRKIKWKPQHMQTRYEEWVKGLNQDWCISRQRFFGVPFPVWYKLDAKGMPDYTAPLIASLDRLPVDPMIDVPDGYTEAQRNQPNGFIGDKDVMDTWATSALTPQIAMSLNKDKAMSLPFDIRPQAHDIIRTWAFYTVAKALMHENMIPWHEVLVSGFILDPDRKKMSKSKGNVVTPQHLIDQYGADSIRYWAGKARLGVDTAFEENVMSQGKKLVNKIFNASKFVFNIVENNSAGEISYDANAITAPTDKAWQEKMDSMVLQATKYLHNYDYAGALELIEKRFWDFCDNYLEIVKKRAYSENNASALASLIKTIDTFLSVFAPFCPFITEEIYQARPWAGDNQKSIHASIWPKAAEDTGASDKNLYDYISEVTSYIRKAKTEANMSQKTAVKSVVVEAPANVLEVLKQGQTDVENVGGLLAGALVTKVSDEILVKDIILEMPQEAAS